MKTTRTGETKTGKSGIQGEIAEVLDLMDVFKALLVAETDALKKADFKKVDSLQPEKQRMAKQYETQIKGLFAKKAEMITVDLKLRERVVSARTQFTKTLYDNMRAIDNARKSSKRLVERILQAARDAVEEKTVYGGRGKMEPTQKILSVRIDQSL